MLTDVEGEGGAMHHCTDRSGDWKYVTRELPKVTPTDNSICIAGLGFIGESKRAQALKLMSEVALHPIDTILPSGEPFNCRTWLKMAIYEMDRARVIKLISDVGECRL